MEVGRGRNGVPMSLIIDHACRVYITQIPLERIERDGANALRAEFESFGPVESYKMFTERSGRFIGSVLCTYRNPADATAAVQNMNGQTIDGSVLQVSLSRDHGVVLLHRGGAKGRHDSADDCDGDGKWQHDRYQALMEGGDDDTFNDYAPRRGGRRGGLRRGGAGRGINSVDEAFEQYIALRDKAAMEANKSTNNNNVGGSVAGENKEQKGSEKTQMDHNNDNDDQASHMEQAPTGDLKMTENEES